MRARAGQTMIEMATITAVIVAALLGMQIYMKRSFSGRLREAADQIGEPYAPRRTSSSITTTFSSSTQTSSTLVPGQNVDAMETTQIIGVGGIPEQNTRTGTETVGPYGASIWDP